MACRLCRGTGWIRCYCRQPGCTGWRRCPNACFARGTKVLTPVGQRAIEDFAVGDPIMSWNELQQRLQEDIVKKVIRGQGTYFAHITLDDGTSIEATANHTILTPTGWTCVALLEVGDRVSRVCEGTVESSCVRTIFLLYRTADVYNLVPRKNPIYITESLVAHSFTHMRKTRTLLHASFA